MTAHAKTYPDPCHGCGLHVRVGMVEQHRRDCDEWLALAAKPQTSFLEHDSVKRAWDNARASTAARS